MSMSNKCYDYFDLLKIKVGRAGTTKHDVALT